MEIYTTAKLSMRSHQTIPMIDRSICSDLSDFFLTSNGHRATYASVCEVAPLGVSIGRDGTDEMKKKRFYFGTNSAIRITKICTFQ